MSRSEVLARYIENEILNGRAVASVSEDDDLLASGLVDSLGVMSLILFIEREMGVDVPPEDVTIENFMSISTIEAYLARREGEAGESA